MLEATNLHAFYGKSHVLHGVDLSVAVGERIAMELRQAVDEGMLDLILT